MKHYEMEKKRDKESDLVKNVLPEYFKNKNLHDKLTLVENADQSEDNIQMNFLADDSYLEPDSLSYLDQETIKNMPLDKRLSFLNRAESDNKNESAGLMKFNFGSTPVTPSMRKQESDITETPKISDNERLLDALDSMDDNLMDDSLRFSFSRVSLLDVGDRNSIVHGPSFKNNREYTERLSIKRRSSNRGMLFIYF